MKKKILCIVMAITLMATAFAVPAAAETEPDYTLSLKTQTEESVETGKTFDVDIIVTSDETAYNYIQMTVTYDTAKIEFESFKPACEGSTFLSEISENIKGSILITCTGDDRAITDGTATFGTLTFKVLHSAIGEEESVVSEIAIAADPLVGKSGVTKETKGNVGSKASVTIIKAPYILGDVTGDSVIDADDITRLARHVAKISSLEGSLLDAADTDSNGVVDADDITHLARYVAKIIPEL